MVSPHYYQRLRVAISVLLALTFFAIPISSTGKSILVPIVLLLIVMEPSYRQRLWLLRHRAWCQATFLLFFMVLLASAWGPASFHEKILVIGKYSKLLYLPMLAVGFHDRKTRGWGMHAFLAAMWVTSVLSVGQSFGLWGAPGAAADQVFRNHIMTSHMMAFAAYLSAWLFLQTRTRWRWGYVLLVILFSYQLLFINTGRMGYVTYAVLMVLFIVQTWPWQKAVGAALLGALLLTAGYYQSTTMQSHVQEAVTDYRNYHHNQKDSSIGYRLQFYAFAGQLFQKHPWLGNGTGSFTASFRQEAPVASWSRRLLEPHSQYWLVAVELGVVGLFALLYFFGSLLWVSFQLQEMRSLAFAVIIPFMIGNLSDSLLFYSGSGYFFLMGMALCLGELPSRHRLTGRML